MAASEGCAAALVDCPNVRSAPLAIELVDEVMLPEHHPLPVRKHSGSKREGFAAVQREIRRRDGAGEGAASHGKCEA